MAIDLTKKLIRNSLRLRGYDYSDPGAYFVTICTDQKICYFGNIVDGIMIPFPIIDVVREIWLGIPKEFRCVCLDAFIIMPNHIHGIIIINKENKNLHSENSKENPSFSRNLFDQANRDCRSRQGRDFGHTSSVFMNPLLPKRKNRILKEDSKQMVDEIIRYFKAKSTRIIHGSGFPRFNWQSHYFEHVVRSARELNAIREYIINNPIKWSLDRENRLSKNFNMELDKYFIDVFEE